MMQVDSWCLDMGRCFSTNLYLPRQSHHLLWTHLSRALFISPDEAPSGSKSLPRLHHTRPIILPIMLFSSTARLLRPFASSPSPLSARGLATLASQHTLQVLEAPNLSYAQQRDHVDRVSSQLERTGMLKISLGFPDDSSSYLKQLLVSLHEHHHHRLPISHSAKRGWFWDVRPNETTFQAVNHQVCSSL